MKKHRASAILLLLWTTLAGADTGYMLKATDLKVKAFLDAETLMRLPERTAVEIVARQGPWILVKTQGKQGYVRMLQVRLAVSETMLVRAAPPLNRPAGTSPIVTTGVRGFDEQGLKDAQPDPAAFARMVSYAATRDQAQQFAQRSPLGARALPYYGENGKPLKEAK